MVDSAEDSEFEKREEEWMGRLLYQCRQVIPGSWREAVLELEGRYSGETGKRSVSHRLRNPLTGEQITEFTQQLFMVSNMVHALHIMAGNEWERCVVEMGFDEDGEMDRCEARYS